MQTNALTEKLKKIFIEEAFGKPVADNDELGIHHRIRLTLDKRDMKQLRNTYQGDEKGWLRPDELIWEMGALSRQDVPHWDVKEDGSAVVHLCAPFTFYFYNVEELTEEESNKVKKDKIIKEQEKVKREKALLVLTEKLINKMPSLNYIYSGDLEINHGIHLKEIKRGMYMDMPYTPNYGNGNLAWVVNKVLSWGGAIGWDVAQNAEIVCCRVHYDDYINFKVELLTEEEIAEYKKKFEKPDNFLINRMVTLKELFENELISETEYQQKRNEIMNEI